LGEPLGKKQTLKRVQLSFQMPPLVLTGGILKQIILQSVLGSYLDYNIIFGGGSTRIQILKMLNTGIYRQTIYIREVCGISITIITFGFKV
jgi:hypothetical protein